MAAAAAAAAAIPGNGAGTEDSARMVTGCDILIIFKIFFLNFETESKILNCPGEA